MHREEEVQVSLLYLDEPRLMKNKDILFSGASIAGLALALWLRRYGCARNCMSPTLAVKGAACFFACALCVGRPLTASLCRRRVR
jgi:hypothetical protein